MRPRLLTYSLLVLLLTSCLPDDSDDCCGVRIHFDYFEAGQDLYRQEIHSMRHFLFDGQGRFLRELPSHYDRDIVLTDIEAGDYRLVTVANATAGRSGISGMQEHVSTLDGFELHVNSLRSTRAEAGATYDNTDQLFYGNLAFTVGDVLDLQLTSVLSNIHCHLHVLVYWKRQLPYGGEYTLRAYDVPSGYRLGNSYDLAALKYPQQTDSLVVHARSEIPVNFELEFEMVSLRYTDDSIPVLQLFHGDEPVTSLVPLKRAFDWWDWHPGSTPVQDYWLQMEIDEEGTVRLNRWGQGKVLDWINGGTIAG